MAEDRKRTGDAFWEFFETAADKSAPNGCWEWQGHVTHQGYGAVHLDGKIRRPHRLAYERYVGPVPDDLSVCHTCDNRKCVNPAHLFLGTHQENMADMAKKERHKFGLATGGYARRKLTPEQVRAIRADMRTQRQIAAAFGIDQSNVFAIKHRRSYANID